MLNMSSMLRVQLTNQHVPSKFKSFVNKGEKKELASPRFQSSVKKKLRKNVKKKFRVTLNLLQMSSSPQRISILLVQ